MKKKDEKEMIKGQEFERRLKEQYGRITGMDNELFRWANKEENVEKSNDEEDIDPIAQLLKTNTKVFGSANSVFKSNKLKF